MSIDLHELATFLVEAKRRTYAGLDDDATLATPALANAKQLEHRAGAYLYRDIYFGIGFFVGQETVTSNDRVIWSMSYGGGIRADIADRETVVAVYAFLRMALLKVETDHPYRGPAAFASGGLSYSNVVGGDLARFHGVETIERHGRDVYQLHYAGGLLR
ncbi:DUF5680 domain-containing protein [Bradyrhizobium sp. HKCCYLS20291]|uniref:DUF5680 domain-containing protein n=1 Tax=Bradyrhizobium sp. HKCCYLS20291 TaxID=3420766 RepID=UPI003EBF0186